MAKFKDGDMVVRLTQFQQDDNWLMVCREHHTEPTAVLTVNAPQSWQSVICIAEFGEDMTRFESRRFRLATGLEVKMGCALPAEDHIAEKEAHVECLREKVAELLRDLDTTRNQLDVAMRANNRLSDDIAAANDQRDAAVLAAKSLGDEVYGLRQERRGLRLSVVKATTKLDPLRYAIDDLRLKDLYKQLNQIGCTCDEQGNGADAKMLWDAAQVVEMVLHLLHEGADE